MSHTEGQVISKDGTAIAYETNGEGPPLVLVDGALCSRAFGPMPKLAERLAPRFTVVTYDRRGRGESGDTPPYAKAREIEDLAALVEAVGGPAFLVGLSSGGALALEAAANGVGVRGVVSYEAPYVGDRGAGAAHEPALREILARGDRAGAVTYFMRTMVGVPAPFVWMMKLMPWVWSKLKAVAHTLPYDAAVMGSFEVPAERLATIRVPAHVMYGSKTDPRIVAAAERLADAVPGATLRALEGQTHQVSPDALVPVVEELFAESR